VAKILRGKILLIVLVLIVNGYNSAFASGNNGIIFIENKGQFPEQVRFYAEIPGGMLFIEENTLTYSFKDPNQTTRNVHLLNPKTRPSKGEISNHYALKVRFIEANSNVDMQGKNTSMAKYNYFYGNEPDKWATGARGFKKILIKEIYSGVNLEISSANNQLKYDLLLEPGANPACIQMHYDGASSLDLVNNKLNILLPYFTLQEQIPASYAICDSVSRAVNSSYRLTNNIVSFEVGHVDKDEALVIDPLLVFSTYSGSPSDNWGNTATYDEQGNGYAGGMTHSERPIGAFIGNFPATAGAYQTQSAGGWDVAISKYDSAGSNLLYATHLGGSGTDVPQSMIVNAAGELLILGVTGSGDFPVSLDAYANKFSGGSNHTLILGVDFTSGSDLFIAKLSADGSQLLASTYIGGSDNDGRLADDDDLARNYGDESRGDIIFDADGNILVASRTASVDFPLINGYSNNYHGGATDAIVIKMSGSLDSLIWGTYIGGGGTDVALSIKLDSSNNVFVAGGTTSSNFPLSKGAYQENYNGGSDGWVALLTSSGDSLIASTYIGTSEYDQVFFLDLDVNEDVYLAGQTEGLYPKTAGIYANGNSGQFIHKLSHKLDSSIFSTTINTIGRTIPAISLTAFLVNECDNIYLAGWGSPRENFSSGAKNFQLNTIGLPVTSDAYQLATDGSSFYLMVLSGDATELLYATHLGDANSFVHVDGGTSRFDKHGIVYHSVCASCFGDSSFPTTEGAWSQQNGSTGCNNALFKFDLASLRARIQTNTVAFDNPGIGGGCLPFEVVFENNSTGGKIYEWDFGDGHLLLTESKDTIVHLYKQPGEFRVELRAFDPNTCISEDFAYTTINVFEPNFSLEGETIICLGGSSQLNVTGGSVYVWLPVEGLSDPTIANPVASPLDTTTYKVSIINFEGCNFEDSITINVVTPIEVSISLEQNNVCQGSRKISIINNSEFAGSVTWDFGDGAVADEWEPEHTFAEDGNYEIRAVLVNQACSQELILNVNIQQLNIPNVLTRNDDGINEVLKITSSNPVNLSIFTRWGTKVYSEASYQNNWRGEGLASGIYYYEAVLVNNEVCSGWIQLLDGT